MIAIGSVDKFIVKFLFSFWKLERCFFCFHMRDVRCAKRTQGRNKNERCIFIGVLVLQLLPVVCLLCCVEKAAPQLRHHATRHQVERTFHTHRPRESRVNETGRGSRYSSQTPVRPVSKSLPLPHCARELQA